MPAVPAIYIFSGLGADHRAFQLMDFGQYEIHHMKWIKPLKKERMEDYALRISSQITNDNPVLIGLSFGGMVAMEVAKHIAVKKIILLSSAKTRNELPFYYKWTGRLGFHHLLPESLLTHSNAIVNWLFGAKSTFEKQVLKQILSDTDPAFLKWAIHEIVTWRNDTINAGIFHIHGTADRILPIRFTKPDVVVFGGNHLMTLNKATELSSCILNHLALTV